MKLRNYQNDAQQSTLNAWAEGSRSVLGCLPTGCGKTIVFASIVRRLFPKRAMILAHRQELVWQAKDKIKRVTGLQVDVEMGEHKVNEGGLFARKSPVVVSTIQTHCAGGDGSGRIGKFDPNDFGLLVIDEAHHAVSPSYRRVMDYYLTNPNLVILGVTATPDRADEEALGQIFETVAFDYEILDAIHDGWLVPIDQQMVNVDSLDFTGVRTTAGDLNGSDLAAVMEAEKNLHGIASPSIEIIGSRRGIGFASSVVHAQALAEIFNRHRSGMAACVSAKTDKGDREKIIRDFANGDIQFLWNCGVFTEGFDDAGVEVIIMGRPTKSRALYAQMAGRATRPHESIAHSLNDSPNPAHRRWCIQKSPKPSCLIVDFVGNSGKHKLVNTTDILGGKVSDEVLEAATEFAMRAGKPVRMTRAIEEEEKKAEEAKLRRLAEESRKARLVGKATYSTRGVNPFDVLDVKPVKSRGWDKGKILSEKQRAILRDKMGVDPDSLPYHQARQLIDEQFRRWEHKLCTFKQAATLKKFGVNAKDMTFEQASHAIDAIAKNGWRRPASLQPQTTVTATAETTKPVNDDIPF